VRVLQNSCGPPTNTPLETAHGPTQIDGTGSPNWGPLNRLSVLEGLTEDDGWRIAIAVAGFSEDDLAIEVRDRSLIVTARKAEDAEERTYLHRGIATRAFERRFTLADHVRVTGASHENGMLNIDLIREVPEAHKPRQIAITKAPEKAANLVEAEKVN